MSSVEQILRSIRELNDGQRLRLFLSLSSLYESQGRFLPRDTLEAIRELVKREAVKRQAWDESRYGFTGKERALLTYLDGKDQITERKVIAHLWPEAQQSQAALRARLRQLAKRANNRLIRLKLAARIVRLRPGYLHLIPL